MNFEARPRRVAMVTDWFMPRMGGIEIHIAELARMLTARGQDIRIVTSTPGAAGVQGFAVTQISSPLLPVFDLAVSPQLIERLKADFVAGQYDVIHAHISIVSPVGLGAILAAHALGLPTIASFHSVLLRSADFLRITDRLLNWSRWPIVAVGVSGLIAAQLRAAMPRLDTIVIPNGVDMSLWHRPPMPRERPASEIVAVATNRLVRKKRPFVMLDAFAKAQDMASAHGRRLVLRVVGDGPLREKLQRRAARLGLSRDVTYLGRVPLKTLIENCYNADFYLNTERHEAFGIATLEARCAGLPVVGMREAGITEFLTHGENALLAADDTEFARFVERLALDDELRHKLARPEPDLARFDWPAVIDAHIACQERAIAAAKARSGTAAG